MPSGTWKKDTPEERSSSPCEANPKGLFTQPRRIEILGSSPSDDAYRAQHRTGGRALDLVDAEDVGKLVDLIFCQGLLIMVLKDVHALPREQVDVDRVEAGPVVELLFGREHLYA